MSVSSSELQELYDALVRQIAAGVTQVKYKDKQINYASIDDMLKAKSSLEAQLGIKGSRKSQKILSSFSKGTK